MIKIFMKTLEPAKVILKEQSCVIYINDLNILEQIFLPEFRKTYTAPGLKGLISGSPATWINSPTLARVARVKHNVVARIALFAIQISRRGGLMTAHEEGLLSSVDLVAERDGRDESPRDEIDARVTKPRGS